MRQKFNVTGMSCAACQARVEKAVSALPGVSYCTVSLLTNSMNVEGTVSEQEIIAAVESAGYGAALADSGSISCEDLSTDSETRDLRNRLTVSVILSVALMFIEPAIIRMMLAAVVMIINRRFFISGFKSVMHGAANMDTLVALGSSASFLWSVYSLFVLHDTEKLYFDSAAMILALITVGKMLEARSKGRTTDALRSLMKLAPQSAIVIADGEEKELPIEEVRVGDIFVVRPGSSIPVDGTVIEGCTAVDESALTGESIPADKEVGDHVSAATINRSGFIKCRANRVGEDTTIAQIIKMVSDAAATKAPAARIADKISGIFVPTVVAISLITLAVWIIIGKEFDFALARAIAVLVISCPCALGLATPVAIMVGNGVGARNAILFKTASSLEEVGRVQIVVMDKTGTITEGAPVVSELYASAACDEEELLRIAYSLEKKSEHPLAKAIVREAESRGLTAAETENFMIKAGNGLSADIEGRTIYGGSQTYIEGVFELEAIYKEKISCYADDGMTPVLFADGDKVIGIIAIADTVKPDCAMAVEELRGLGVRTLMLTGDNKRTALTIAGKAGIESVIAEVMPDGKEQVVSRLKKIGKVAMVGDGINDAPALAAADVGMAIGAGTDVAIDAADVVLVNSRVSDIPAAIRLSRATLRNIHENLFWAFFYNALCIPLAAGCYAGWLGWEPDPMIAAAAMSLSSFCVVTNALRLNMLKVHSGDRDRKHNNEVSASDIGKIADEFAESQIKKKETSTMTEKIIIEGMMCPMCEKHVKNALESIEGIETATPSHTEGAAVIELSREADVEIIRKAIEDAGYKLV